MHMLDATLTLEVMDSPLQSHSLIARSWCDGTLDNLCVRVCACVCMQCSWPISIELIMKGPSRSITGIIMCVQCVRMCISVCVHVYVCMCICVCATNTHTPIL